MQLGMIGLGKMGANMTRRLLGEQHEVAVYDVSEEARATLAEEGATSHSTLESLVQSLVAPRTLWLMIPAGDPVEQTLAELTPLLSEGDLVIDGGNSNYKDTQRRAAELEGKGLLMLDVGTSGGIWGLLKGYCLMVGGSPEAFARLEPALQTLAQPNGYAHVGPSGAGHYAKMIHNGIEYGMLQAYAEGFELLHAKSEFSFNLQQLSSLWNHGSVVRSWLLELAEHVFAQEPDLASIRGWVADSGEGRWTVQEAIDLDVPAPVITLSLLARFASRQDESFAAKTIAALRKQFGGHAIKEAE